MPRFAARDRRPELMDDPALAAAAHHAALADAERRATLLLKP
jgi:hypothetical protein